MANLDHLKNSFLRIVVEGNNHWVKDPKGFDIRLGVVTQQLEDLLVSRGWVLLNDAYRRLGLDEFREGATHGWALSARNHDGIKINSDRIDDQYLVRFKTDGVIIDHIPSQLEGKMAKWMTDKEKRCPKIEVVFFDQYEDAKCVLDVMERRIREHGVVTLGDYYSMIGMRTNFSMEHWGWRSLDGVVINCEADKYCFIGPEPVYLD